MPAIFFDPLAHEYRVDGAPARSVTTLIRAAGYGDMMRVPRHALQRGETVHRFSQQIDSPFPNLLDVDPCKLDGYCLAYLDFKSKHPFDWSHVEHRAAFVGTLANGEIARYAGTIDRASVSQSVVLDIKTGGPAVWHGLQLAAYSMLLPSGAQRWLNVYLSKTGRFRVREYTADDQQKLNDEWIDIVTAYAVSDEGNP